MTTSSPLRNGTVTVETRTSTNVHPHVVSVDVLDSGTLELLTTDGLELYAPGHWQHVSGRKDA